MPETGSPSKWGYRVDISHKTGQDLADWLNGEDLLGWELVSFAEATLEDRDVYRYIFRTNIERTDDPK